MIVVRCANGYVLYRISQFRKNVPRVAFCVNDGQKFTIRRDSAAHTAADVAALGAHAIQLQGAIQFFSEIDLD